MLQLAYREYNPSGTHSSPESHYIFSTPTQRFTAERSVPCFMVLRFPKNDSNYSKFGNLNDPLPIVFHTIHLFPNQKLGIKWDAHRQSLETVNVFTTFFKSDKTVSWLNAKEELARTNFDVNKEEFSSLSLSTPSHVRLNEFCPDCRSNVSHFHHSGGTERR